MRDAEYMSFLEAWSKAMYVSAAVMIIAAIAVAVLYNVKYLSKKTLKEKWDFVNKNQIRYFWYSILCIAIAVAMVANTIDNQTVGLSIFWFFIRLFISIAAGTLIGYVIYLILKFYYPGRMQNRLNRLRYTPRVSSAGNKMKLLSEEEEDVHLDAGMQAEEEVFSVDYDVWVDPATNEVKIEKYPGNLVAHKCNNCGFQTMRLKREEIIEEASDDKDGQLLKHFECSYCKSIRTTQHTIAPLIKSDKDYKLPEHLTFRGDKQIRSIMIEIVGSDGATSDFYFQNKKEAIRFLEEFTFEKVND